LALYKSANFSAAVGTSNWFQYTVTNVCNIASTTNLGDPFFNTYSITGSVSQIVAPPGSKTVRYRFVYFQANDDGGSCYFDSAVLNQTGGLIPPLVSSLFPQNMIFVNPGDGLSFNASSPQGTTIPSNSISVVLNGSNISPSLSISGTTSNKTVSYHGLQSNMVYNATISVTDASNVTTVANTYFETTWIGIQPILYLWEAEDFDFNGGNSWDHPILCTTIGTSNCYFGTIGTQGIDEFTNGYGAAALQYRPFDAIGTTVSGDYNRKDHYQAGVYDYRIDPFDAGMWVNYTHNWSNGTYWVVARISTDNNKTGSLTLSNATTGKVLGTFTNSSGLGWSTFQTVYLKDTNGINALVTLNGKQTLTLACGAGNILPNFLALVVAQPDLPVILSMYPTGSHPFEFTNAFFFSVIASGSSFPANGIRMTLDGVDVSSNLVITGSTSTKNVLYPNLLPNAIHLAVLTITNVLGHGIAVTNKFDTFTDQNYFVEAEDFDYDGGQYLDNVQPDSYGGASGVTNIDFYHTPLDHEVYSYRPVGIPQDFLNRPGYPADYAGRSNFVAFGSIDYDLVFFAANDWANYTHVYPTGNFFVYIRTSGDGPFSMYLDQVVSGATTTNQITKRLGRFAGFGVNSYQVFDWVPLTDDGMAAPSVVNLNGLATLRLTTGGNCNPNYFMLVPTSGITVTATRSGGNIALSFPTQSGVKYRVFYKTDVAGSTWTLLTTVLGNGSVKTVTDPPGSTRRFYKVTAP
jgi:hypothetical protein